MTVKNTLPKKNQGYFLVLFAALFASSLLSACKKDTPEREDTPVSFVKLVHSLPGYSSLDFYLGGARATTPSLLYTQSTAGYGGLYSGKYMAQIGVGGSTQELARSTVDLAAFTNYSFFATTKSATNDTVSFLITRDSIVSPSASKANIRFVNVGRSTTAFDLGISSGATWFTNKAYNTYTNFMEVNPGTYTVELRDAGTGTVRVSKEFVLADAKVYTIFSSGKLDGPAEMALGLSIIENK